MEQLTELFDTLEIAADTSRSKAKKNKEKSDMHMCIVCFQRTHTHQDLVKHLRKKHKAKASEIKEEFQEAKAALRNNPDSEVEQHNYRLALAKLSFLEKYMK
jgi:gas vesicle protein